MSGINKVFLIGHLGKDPDHRLINDDVAVVSFPFATSEMVKKGDERLEVTEWHNIVMWRGVADSASKTLKKGALVQLEGKLQTRTFVDKAGIKKYITEIIVNTFKLLGTESVIEYNA